MKECEQTSCLLLQIIDVQPNAKATVTTAGEEGEEDSEGMPVEALLGMDMAHPNVVQTYRHTSLPTSVRAAYYVLQCHTVMPFVKLCDLPGPLMQL